jgi:hypothetical protein
MSLLSLPRLLDGIQSNSYGHQLQFRCWNRHELASHAPAGCQHQEGNHQTPLPALSLTHVDVSFLSASSALRRSIPLAALATGNNGDAEAAMNWLLMHLEDADINDPLPDPAAAATAAPAAAGAAAAGGGGGAAAPNPEHVSIGGNVCNVSTHGAVYAVLSVCQDVKYTW